MSSSCPSGLSVLCILVILNLYTSSDVIISNSLNIYKMNSYTIRVLISGFFSRLGLGSGVMNWKQIVFYTVWISFLVWFALLSWW